MVGGISSAKKLFLHVGPPKTGTSAIQRVACSRGTLNFLYPMTGRWSDGAHHNITFNYFQNYNRVDVIPQPVADIARKIQDEVRKAPTKDVFISSEALWGRNLIQYIRDICVWCGVNRENVEVIAVYRDHRVILSSLYNQFVKDNFVRERRDPSEFMLAMTHYLSYSRITTALRGIGIRVKIVEYEPASSFVERFFFTIDAAAVVRSPGLINPSLSRAALVSTLVANRLVGSYEERLPFDAVMKKYNEERSGPAVLFGEDDFAGTMPNMLRDRKFLASEGVNLGEFEEWRKRTALFISHQEYRLLSELLGEIPRIGAGLKKDLSSFVRI